MLALSYFPVLFSGNNDADKTWELYASGRFLAGAQLYRDIFEANQPLILYLYTIPAGIARMLNIDRWFTLQCFTLLCIAASLMLSTHLLHWHRLMAQHRVFLICVCAYGLVMVPDPVITFGDREHLFIILTLPYLISRLPGLYPALSHRLRLLAAIPAAIGFCIKPHCALIWLAANCAHVTMRKEFGESFIRRCADIFLNRENRLIYAVAAAYLLAIALFHPDYYPTALPMALATYWKYRTAFYVKIIMLFLPCVMLGVILVNYPRSYESALKPDIRYLFWIVAGTTAYILANQGWLYTYYPLYFYLTLLAAGMALHHRTAPTDGLTDQQCRKSRQGKNESHAALVLSFLFFVSGSYITYIQHSPSPLMRSIATKLDVEQEHSQNEQNFSTLLHKYVNAHTHAQHRSYYVMSVDFAGVMLLASPEYEWPVRFYSLWMLGALFSTPKDDTSPIRPEEYPRNSWIVDYVANALAEDFAHKKPEVVIVDTSPIMITFGERQFDFLALFSTYPAFRQSWNAYQHVADEDICPRNKPHNKLSACRYSIYRRIQSTD